MSPNAERRGLAAAALGAAARPRCKGARGVVRRGARGRAVPGGLFFLLVDACWIRARRRRSRSRATATTTATAPRCRGAAVEFVARRQRSVWRLSAWRLRCCRAGARCMAMPALPRAREIARGGLLGSTRASSSGGSGERCLMLAGQQGVALAAPPRAGKGTGVVIPNAAQLARLARLRRHQARELDAHRRASGARAGQACYLFDPFAEDGRTARWNPFSYVSPDPRAAPE